MDFFRLFVSALCVACSVALAYCAAVLLLTGEPILALLVLAGAVVVALPARLDPAIRLKDRLHRSRSKLLLFLAVPLLAPLPAQAISITETAPRTGLEYALDAADFLGSNQLRGSSIVGSGKIQRLTGENDGRFNPRGGAFVDSQDFGRVIWRLRFDQPTESFNFAVTDAFDQPPGRWAGIRSSYFRARAGDSVWSIASRERNGRAHWLTVIFDEPLTAARVAFRTRPRDGFGVAAVTTVPSPSPSPVPIPGSLLLLGTAAVLLFGIGVARRSTVAILDLRR